MNSGILKIWTKITILHSEVSIFALLYYFGGLSSHLREINIEINSVTFET